MADELYDEKFHRSAERRKGRIGVLAAAENLSEGEVMLRSSGGASIVLKNDGTVLINGRVIE